MVWFSDWAKTVGVISLGLWKKRKNLKLCRIPNHSTTALAYVGSGRGREAIQKMVTRERERS